MSSVRELGEEYYRTILELLEQSPVPLEGYFEFSELFERCLDQATSDLTAKAENTAEELKYEGYDNESN